MYMLIDFTNCYDMAMASPLRDFSLSNCFSYRIWFIHLAVSLIENHGNCKVLSDTLRYTAAVISVNDKS